MTIEPVYRPAPLEDWDDVPTHDIIGYRIVGNTGTVLGFGETQDEALADARESLFR